MQKDKTRYDSFDLLKFICSLLIVFLHINPFPKDGVFYFFSRGIANIGVPVFFILSGFFFYNKIKTTPNNMHRVILRKYINRLLILLGVWSIPYSLVYDLWWIINGNIFENIVEYTKHVLFGGPGYYLWYIVSLIFATLYCYAIRNWKLYIGMPCVFLLLLLGASSKAYSFLIDGTIIQDFVKQYEAVFFTFRNGLFFGLPCVYVGMLLSKYKGKISGLKCSLSLFVLSLVTVAVEFYLLYINHLSIGTMQLSVLFLAASLVVLCYNIHINLGKSSIVFRKLSFLIYVIHPLYIVLIPWILSKSGRFNLDYYWYLWYGIQIPIIAIASVVTGLILIFLTKRFKFFKLFM